MRIKNKKSNKKIIIILASIILLTGVSFGGYFILNNKKSENTNLTSESDQNKDELKTEEAKTDNDNTNQNSNQNVIEPEKPASQNDTPVSSNGSMHVSGVAFRNSTNLLVQNITIYTRDESGNYLFLSGGTCTLTVGNYKSSQAINPAHTGSNYSTCENFNIPLNQISGNTFKIDVTSSSGQTATFTGDIQ